MLIMASAVLGGFAPPKANGAELLLISGEGDSVSVTAAALERVNGKHGQPASAGLIRWRPNGRLAYGMRDIPEAESRKLSMAV